MQRLLLIASLVLFGSMAIQAAHHLTPHCDDVVKNCSMNSSCNATWNNFVSKCPGPINGYGMCDQACNDSYKAVIMNPIGKKHAKCVCDDTDYLCRAHTTNFRYSCLGVMPPTPKMCDYKLPVKATNKVCDYTPCTGNATCNQTLNVYLATCSSAFQGMSCQSPCKARLQEFICNPIAMKTAGCQCASGDANCFTLTSNILSQCDNIAYPTPAPTQQSCSSVIAACAANPACSAAWGNYTSDCASMFNGTVTTCSAMCKSSFEAVAKNPIGYHITSCSCGKIGICQRDEALTGKLCLGMDLMYPQNCADILAGCGAHPQCNATMTTYLTQCDPSKSSTCSPGCKASASAMIANPIGQRLAQCYCDPSDTACNAVDKLTDNCFVTPKPSTKKPTTKTTVGKPNPTSSAGAIFLAFSAVFSMAASLLL